MRGNRSRNNTVDERSSGSRGDNVDLSRSRSRRNTVDGVKK